jgi:hypothetical protein
VASLAAYSMSLFATSPAHAQECYEMCTGAYVPSGEDWCFQLVDECTVPMFGIHLYKYNFYYATSYIGYHCCFANPSENDFLGSSCSEYVWQCYP